MIDFSEAPHARGMTSAVLNWYERRIELFIEPAADRLKDKRVLDLACYDGALSWAMLAMGATEVTGVEARPESVAQAKELFAGSRYAGRVQFISSDLFTFLDSCRPGDYGAILCAGFLYHTVRQVDFFREMKRLAPKTLIIDTSVAKNYFWFGRRNFGKPPGLFVYNEEAELARNTTDLDGIVLFPTVSFIESMARGAGLDPHRMRIPKGADSRWRALDDFRKGLRAAWVCTAN